MVTFLTPLALILLALIPPIIALYLLKLRRQDRPVSSIYLWQRFVRDVEANAPWQKLRRNLLLLLQILFMLSLIMALARPATEAGGVAGQTVVLILDTSASMGATDVGMTRLQAAQAAARDLVTNLPDDARVTLITAAGGEAKLLLSASQDRRQALAAIAAAQPAALGSDLSPALALAEAIVAREPGAEIVLLSDGVVQLPERLTSPVRFVPFGQSGTNQAISLLSLTTTATGEPALFVQVSNYAAQGVPRRLVIQIDGAPFTAFDLELSPNGHVEQLVEAVPVSAQTIEAYLTPTEADFLAVDDRAWTVLRPAGPVQATLVTRGNFFLQTALSLLGTQRLGSTIELTMAAPEDWKNLADDNQPSSLPTFHIFDSYVPENLPPGNLFFLAPPTSVPGLFEVLGQTTNPLPRPVGVDHPLLQNVNLAETQVLTTTVLSGMNWSQALVMGEMPTGEPVPLLLAGEVAGRRVVILTFSLQQSDLPLRPAFPILMANLVTYLAPGLGGLVPAELAAGDALAISTPPGVNRLRLAGPSGEETSLPVEAGRATLSALEQPGLYRLTFEPASTLAPVPNTVNFAVNFFAPLESAIAPKAELELTGLAGQSQAASSLPPAHQEWWRPLAIGALILLVIEWLVYQRSTVLKLWHTLGWRAAGSK